MMTTSYSIASRWEFDMNVFLGRAGGIRRCELYNGTHRRSLICSPNDCRSFRDESHRNYRGDGSGCCLAAHRGFAERRMTHGKRRLVHTVVIPIRWGDMDAMGHVNNTVYFRYMEQARVDWAHAFARSTGREAYAEDGPLIVNASCTFSAPLTYPGEAEVRMF